MGAGTIYRYFENRDILISDLFKEVEENIIPFILDGYSEQDPFRARFIHLGSQLLRYFISIPSISATWSSFTIRPTALPTAGTRSWAK